MKEAEIHTGEAKVRPCRRASEEFSSGSIHASHWDKVYENTVTKNLGWYEDNPEPSMRLINLCNLDKQSKLLNVGAGATTLIDVLLREGYEHIIANDLSSHALEKLKERLGPEGGKVEWIVDDLTCPCDLNELGGIDLWHDRAVLHFFIEESDQDSYFDLLKRLVNSHGYVMIAAFHLNGAARCSGLPVYRYNVSMLQERLGAEFRLIDWFDYTYTMPSGDCREYVYTLFRRE